MKKLAERKECEIVRNDPAFNKQTVLYDADGCSLLAVDGSWSDEKIWKALRLMNESHAVGYKKGSDEAKQQMRNAMGVNS
jgi:hypothetical protein